MVSKISNLLSIVLEKYLSEGETSKSINDGLCCYFREDVINLKGNLKIKSRIKVDHEFLLYRGRYYDSETLKGVKDWKNLPFYKRLEEK